MMPSILPCFNLSCRAALRVLFVILAGLALAACETTGSGPPGEAAKPPEPPMTHTRAAEICWMATEKGHADMKSR